MFSRPLRYTACGRAGGLRGLDYYAMALNFECSECYLEHVDRDNECFDRSYAAVPNAA